MTAEAQRTPATHDGLVAAMARHVDGDPRAFEQLFRQLAPAVRHCVGRWIYDAALAEDLVQETFLRVHRGRHQYRLGAPVGPWVLTIARRLCIDLLRRADRREGVSPTGELPERPLWAEGGGVEDMDDAAALVAEVRAAIDALPVGMRSVVSLHHLDGRSLAEVAVALGITHGAARVRAHRSYGRLRSSLVGLFDRLRT